MKKKAVILLSGGLDSATTLAMGRKEEFEFYALSFNYQQRHAIELEASKRVAEFFHVLEHKVFDIDLGQIGGSALTDTNIDVPENIEVDEIGDEIPVTYVPARNTIFLSIALGWAEALGVHDIFIGANAVDYSGYPDCRPEYIKSFEDMANLATKAGVEGDEFRIHTPLISLTKSEIIKKGMELGVDYGLTHSCYNPDSNGKSCRKCDSCLLREAGFKEAGFTDPVS